MLYNKSHSFQAQELKPGCKIMILRGVKIGLVGAGGSRKRRGKCCDSHVHVRCCPMQDLLGRFVGETNVVGMFFST